MRSGKVVGKKELEQRIRQLLAIDKNAGDIYADLAKSVEDPKLKAKFLEIAREEGRHVALSKEILALLTG